MVCDADIAGGYQRNPFKFKHFGANRLEMNRNGTSRPIEGFTPNFDNEQYSKAYMTFRHELECVTNDKCVSFTSFEWANKYRLYAANSRITKVG